MLRLVVWLMQSSVVLVDRVVNCHSLVQINLNPNPNNQKEMETKQFKMASKTCPTCAGPRGAGRRIPVQDVEVQVHREEARNFVDDDHQLGGAVRLLDAQGNVQLLVWMGVGSIPADRRPFSERTALEVPERGAAEISSQISLGWIELKACRDGRHGSMQQSRHIPWPVRCQAFVAGAGVGLRGDNFLSFR